MSQHSEERLADAEQARLAAPSSARILTFERPQSELQRAIQERAQEAIERDRERDREVRRPQPLRWLIVLAIAAIPVLLIFSAVDGFLRAFYKVNETYNSAPAQVQPAPEPASPTQPGVVILQPYGAASQDESNDRTSTAQPTDSKQPRQ